MDKYKGLPMNLDVINIKRLIFSEFFILQNKIQTRFDKVLDEITSKQFIILVIVESFPEPPSLTDVAKHAGCSRQNIKKICEILRGKGYLSFITTPGTRAVRIVLEPKFYEFYGEFMEKSASGIEVLFANMTVKEIDLLFELLHKVDNNIENSI